MRLTHRTMTFTFELTELDVRNLRRAIEKTMAQTPPDYEAWIKTLQDLHDELGAAL